MESREHEHRTQAAFWRIRGRWDKWQMVPGYDPDPTGELYPFEVAAAQDHLDLPSSYFEQRPHMTEAECEAKVDQIRLEAMDD
jgi:hypothetical protein